MTQPKLWVFLLVSVCCDTAQALVFLLVLVCCDTAQALMFLLVSALVLLLSSACCDMAQAKACNVKSSSVQIADKLIDLGLEALL